MKTEENDKLPLKDKLICLGYVMLVGFFMWLIFYCTLGPYLGDR